MSFFSSHWRNCTLETATLHPPPSPCQALNLIFFQLLLEFLCFCTVCPSFSHQGICFFKSNQQRSPLPHNSRLEGLCKEGVAWVSQAPRTCLGACSHLIEMSDCFFMMVLGKLQHKLQPLPTLFQRCFVLTASVLCSEQRMEPFDLQCHGTDG